MKPTNSSEDNYGEDPRTYILGPGSVKDIGSVDLAASQAAKIAAGPIRLQFGTRFWGWRHAEDNPARMRDIRAQGYATSLAYACDVAANWTQVRQGQGGKITVVMPRPGYELGLALRWEGVFWGIVTMLPFRSVGRLPIIYQR